MTNARQFGFDVSPMTKGIGFIEQKMAASEAAALGWNLLREELSLPVAVLYEERLRNNLAWMQQFIATYGMKLAPHGKTTMAPRLFDLQIKSGAWGITLATAQQCYLAWKHGVRRVLMANQLVGRENMALISRFLDDLEFEFYCLVDSVDGINQLGRFFSPCRRRLSVLLEIGIPDGRAGVRNDTQLQEVLAALDQWPDCIALCGVEFYEGILTDADAIESFLKRVVSIVDRLITMHRFDREPPLVSGAGSAWYDMVAEVFSKSTIAGGVEMVLRPGCYITHDGGFYSAAQARVLERNPVAQQMHSGLQPALQVWAYIQSVPEERRAIVGLGKRDVSFDLNLPIPKRRFRPGDQTPTPVPAHWTVTKIMDQHAYLQLRKGDDARVGDMVGFDISHPCLTFDRWRVLPVLNSDYQVVDFVETFF
jgi:D-serine dehydratase